MLPQLTHLVEPQMFISHAIRIGVFREQVCCYLAFKVGERLQISVVPCRRLLASHMRPHDMINQGSAYGFVKHNGKINTIV
jgi:hypothetical protein